MQRRDILKFAAALATMPLAQPVFAQGSQAQWSTAAAPSLARQELYPEVLGGRIYVAGGLLNPNTGYSAHFESYDPTDDRWTRLATLPEARHHIALAAAGGLIYGTGGFSGGFPNWRAEASTYVYDPQANRWSEGVPIPYPSAEGVFASIGDRLYLVGGRTRETEDARHFNQHVDTARGMMFDPASGRWEAIADAPTARNSAAAAVIGGRLFVVGGRQAIKQPDGSLRQVNVANLEVYDPKSDRWTVRTPMPQAQGGLAAAAHGGRLYVFGGEQWVPEQKVFANAWVYDPADDRWRALPPLPTPRHGLGAATLGHRIHVFGGGTRVGGDHASAVHEVLVLDGAGN